MESLEPSPEEPVEIHPVSSVTPPFVFSTLPTIRDTQLLEAPLGPEPEESPSSSLEGISAAAPQAGSGMLRLIAVASTFFAIVGLGMLGIYTGFVSVPQEILSRLPTMGKDREPVPLVDRGRADSTIYKPVPTRGPGSSPAGTDIARPAVLPAKEIESESAAEEMASLPLENVGSPLSGISQEANKIRQAPPSVGKKRQPGAAVSVVAATGLIEAVRANDTQRIVLLLNRGCEVNESDARGITPLMTSAEQGNGFLVELFLKMGANPNARDCNGETALMLASARGRVVAVKALLLKGADPKEVNNRGQTAINQLYASGPTLFIPIDACREIVRLITEHEERQRFAEEAATGHHRAPQTNRP